MPTTPFPVEPWRRKGIVVLTDTEIQRCDYDRKGAALLNNEEVYVLEFPPRDETRDNSPVVRDLVDGNLVNRGVVLVQSPFDKDVYEDVAQASQRFALTKHMYFSRCCMYLGAQEIKVEEIHFDEGSKQKTLKLSGGVPQYSGDFSVGSEEIDALRSQLTLHDTFTGGDADLNAADELLRQKGLIRDVNLQSLLDMRRANTPSQLVRRNLTVNLSSETTQNLNVIGGLGFPGFVKFQADYGSIARKKSNYTLTYQVTF